MKEVFMVKELHILHGTAIDEDPEFIRIEFHNGKSRKILKEDLVWRKPE